MPSELMSLKILLPFCVFVEQSAVLRIVAETRGGSFGLLPQRLDCVAALSPGILCYQTPKEGEVYVAIDEGVLVKSGAEVRISVRRAIAGMELAQLHEAVAQAFLALDKDEKCVRTVIAKLESTFLRRLASFQHD